MGKKVYQWEGDTTQPRGNFTWKSKKFPLPTWAAFSCARVKFSGTDRTDYWALVEAYHAALVRNRTLLSDLAPGGTLGEEIVGVDIAVGADELEDVSAEPTYTGEDELQLKVYMEGTLVETKEVYHEKPFRITSKRGRAIEVEIIGNVTVSEVSVATSVKELKGEQGG